MDSVKSIKVYGKVDEAQDLELKKNIRKRGICIGVSIVVLVAIAVSLVVLVAVHIGNNSFPNSAPWTPAAALKTVCSVTLYPASCISSISKLPSSNTTTDPVVLFKLSLKVIADELSSVSHMPRNLAEETDDESIKSALGVCGNMFEEALYRVNETVSAMDGKNTLNPTKIDDLKTWLSVVVIDHDTCIDALGEHVTESTNLTISRELKSAMVNSTKFTSNSLAIVTKILAQLSEFERPNHRRRLLKSANSFPSWVHPGVRRLLQRKTVTPDVTVAADGSGDVKTVNEAVARVPNMGTRMFVIYVKSGTYVENVDIDKNKWNVMIYGDGKNTTIISGSKNSKDGVKTYNSATLGVEGKGFIMKDIGVINTAGAEKGQAVALRSDADRSVFYRCSFEGFQDTLYTKSNRQYYRNCDVTGTVDFIFGSAAVIFEECNILPRQPLPGQYNTITAAGGNDPNLQTGISIQRCTIKANGNVTAQTYLGRPWNYFSTTVIMESWIGPIVNPAGWAPWNKTLDPPAKGTLYYGEYKNTGPGSDVSKRVKWAGYHPIMSDAEAGRFNVTTFLRGNDNWMPGVPY